MVEFYLVRFGSLGEIQSDPLERPLSGAWRHGRPDVGFRGVSGRSTAPLGVSANSQTASLMLGLG